MEPSEINGGRFYIRPLHDDDRIDDRPALAAVFGHPVDDDFVEKARRDWLSDTAYTWASCEQTCIDMAALITLVRHGDGTCTVTGKPAGDDIAEGKRTVLVARALELATGPDRVAILAGLGHVAGTAQALAAIERTGARDAVEADIAALLAEARDALAGVPGPGRAPLERLLVQATQRVR